MIKELSNFAFNKEQWYLNLLVFIAIILLSNFIFNIKKEFRVFKIILKVSPFLLVFYWIATFAPLFWFIHDWYYFILLSLFFLLSGMFVAPFIKDETLRGVVGFLLLVSGGCVFVVGILGLI